MPNTRFALSFVALLMGSAMSQPAMAGWFDSGSTKDDKAATDKKSSGKSEIPPAQNLDGAIRQAQQQRLDGHYDEAVKQLSQIMLVASDDPRVVTEYGKTMAAMGRSTDAVNFLTRAQQLSPNDWSIYSALGVAYDESGDQHAAQIAYDHALTLKPGEASVLNNYALSRMLAKDPDGAKKLIARAESAGGATDPKIARNIAMIKQLAPATAVAAAAPALPPGAQPAPYVAAGNHPAQQAVNQPAPAAAGAPHSLTTAAAQLSGAPRALTTNAPVTATPLPVAQPSVVMQRVPADQLAGPVAHVAAHAAKPEAPKVEAKAEAKPEPKTDIKPDTKGQPKAMAAKADNQPNKALEARAEDLAKLLGKAPAAKAEAKPAPKVADAKPAPAKTADAKPLPAKNAMAKPVVKAADAKPAPVKTADAKADAKTDAKVAKKDTIPGLRMSANTY